MNKLTLGIILTFLSAPFAQAQMPPPPKDDFPKPAPADGKKQRENKNKKLIEPENKGVKPATPVIPPTPEPSAPDEPTH